MAARLYTCRFIADYYFDMLLIVDRCAESSLGRDQEGSERAACDIGHLRRVLWLCYREYLSKAYIVAVRFPWSFPTHSCNYQDNNVAEYMD